jgi:hypothetical protein
VKSFGWELYECKVNLSKIVCTVIKKKLLKMDSVKFFRVSEMNNGQNEGD